MLIFLDLFGLICSNICSCCTFDCLVTAPYIKQRHVWRSKQSFLIDVIGKSQKWPTRIFTRNLFSEMFVQICWYVVTHKTRGTGHLLATWPPACAHYRHERRLCVQARARETSKVGNSCWRLDNCKISLPFSSWH